MQTGNRQMMDYHIFAPKFTNHGPGMEAGVQPTQQGPSRFSNTRLREPMPHGIGFGARGVPPQPQREGQFSPDAPIGATRQEQVDYFNRAIDSMHLPEDMQRPVATRDLMKSDYATSDEQRAADAAQTNRFMTGRQFSGTGLDGNFIAGHAGTFDDMFY
jgi:hypothetical protein